LAVRNSRGGYVARILAGGNLVHGPGKRGRIGDTWGIFVLKRETRGHCGRRKGGALDKCFSGKSTYHDIMSDPER